MMRVVPTPALVRNVAGQLPALIRGSMPGLVLIAALACVLVPLPTFVVDVLLSLSLAGAAALVLAGLSVRRTSEFLSFPAILLFATLFRLALNISTTRLILSQADAGRVIETFAGFVVRGDLVVGFVMFLIITLVQFVVIAKGSERVAEVAARFALDGLPGQQSAIDADLRSGAISPQEATLRRARLIERSNFYGAMDGAVRFVKGDAVAGLAITAINLCGGLAIGMGRRGLSFGETLDTYGRLTVGDGLMSQIPAVLVSLAAGVMAARVDEEHARARSWLSELSPRVLAVPSLLLALLACVPGMPTLAFGGMGLVGIGAATWLWQRQRGFDDIRAPMLQVRVSPHDDTIHRDALAPALAEVREQAAATLGVAVPAMALVADANLQEGELALWLHGRSSGARMVGPRAAINTWTVAVFRTVLDVSPWLLDLKSLEGQLATLSQRAPATVRLALQRRDLPALLGDVRAFLRDRLPLPPLEQLTAALA